MVNVDSSGRVSPHMFDVFFCFASFWISSLLPCSSVPSFERYGRDGGKSVREGETKPLL